MNKKIPKADKSKYLKFDAFNFDKLMRVPLTLDLARIKNPNCSKEEAATQTATALHEACHIVIAVLGGHPTTSAVIPTTKPLIKYGMEVAGWAGVYDDGAGWYAVLNRMTAALFDWILAGFEETPPVKWDFEAAIDIISGLHYAHPKQERDIYIIDWISSMRYTHLNLSHDTKQFIFDSALANVWIFLDNPSYYALIRATAISLLIRRDKDSGLINPVDMKYITNGISCYSPYHEGLPLPYSKDVPTFQEDIKTLWKWHGIDIRKSSNLLKRFSKVCKEQKQFENRLEDELQLARAD